MPSYISYPNLYYERQNIALLSEILLEGNGISKYINNQFLKNEGVFRKISVNIISAREVQFQGCSHPGFVGRVVKVFANEIPPLQLVKLFA